MTPRARRSFPTVPAFIAASALLLVAVAAILILLVPEPILPASPSQLQALSLPLTSIEAATNGAPRPLTFRSLRLSSLDKTVVLFSGESDVEEIEEGRTLSMSFQATTAFKSVGAFLSTQGTDGALAVLSLKNAAGQQIGQSTAAPAALRAWVDLSVPLQTAGRYTLEITKKGKGRLAWVGKTVQGPVEPTAAVQNDRVAFRLGQVPQYANSSVSIPLGVRADALYFLGGLSSYDHGMSWWDDYEVRGDFGDRQFIGDEAGKVEVVYEDGSRDTIPLIFGWNMWWYSHFDGPEAGGPFLEPFLSDQEARTVLLDSLRLENFSPDPASRYYWAYLPRPKRIAEIRLIDNPEKQGFPIFRAITALTHESADNLTAIQSDAKPGATAPAQARAIAPPDLEASSYRGPLESLKRLLYTYRDGLPASVPKQASTLTPQIEFFGPLEADILSNVFAVNLPDLLAKQDDDGQFHASAKDSVNWGSYQGIGTWRPGAAPFYNQSWARDMGRALLEFARLGFTAKAEAGIGFVDSHLYDLPNGYPTFNRDGQKVPPHWTTVLGEPLYGDKDGKGDGDQANDGHGLLLLAHYRLWQQKGEDRTWLEDRWPFIRDAADWYVFQLDNPGFSRARDVLYTESESSRDGGYDVYSNFIALKAIEKASDMATAVGQTGLAGRWTAYAGRLKRGMLSQLVIDDAKYGKVWVPVAWNWSYAHESLGPLILSADVDGFDVAAIADPELLSISLNTYRRQAAYRGGLATPQTLGYGQSFLTQAALLTDDAAAYSEALGYLARFIYYPRHEPFLVPEGVTLHPSGEYWYRNGDLGNAVHQAEVLKTLSIVAGVDNLRGDDTKIVPRLPDGWTGIKVTDYPVMLGRARLSYLLNRQSNSISMVIRQTGEPVNLSVRIGPIPDGATEVRANVDGKAVPARIVRAGQRDWAWLDRLAIQSGKEIEIRVEWTGG